MATAPKTNFLPIFGVCMNLVYLLCLYLFIQTTSAQNKKDCYLNFEKPEKILHIAEECYNITQPEFSKFPWNAKMEEFDFDDLCYFQCVYGRLKILSKGLIDRERISEIFDQARRASNGNLVNKTVDAWNNCINESEKIGKSKDFSECKIRVLHGFCAIGKVDALIEDCKKKAPGSSVESSSKGNNGTSKPGIITLFGQFSSGIPFKNKMSEKQQLTPLLSTSLGGRYESSTELPT